MAGSLPLEHAEFVRRYRANEIRCHVNLSAAMHICDEVKEAGGCVHQGSKAIGCSLPFLGIVLFFVTDWWKAVLCILLGIIVSSAVRKTAGQNVIELALRDEASYQRLIHRNVILVDEVNGS